ncbi:derlin-2 [Plasmodium ovale curtisi]|uniref:Derlin n=1 Tax=Plasmodium ovale curtisi TaxID=864141 RepID=A0A1A8WUY1_PLAOA|nr:derlin-2 [Plasmodium ovale curtisi]SBS96736.1 derlin-2 [Plasmodium ovale curtisi]
MASLAGLQKKGHGKRTMRSITVRKDEVGAYRHSVVEDYADWLPNTSALLEGDIDLNHRLRLVGNLVQNSSFQGKREGRMSNRSAEVGRGNKNSSKEKNGKRAKEIFHRKERESRKKKVDGERRGEYKEGNFKRSENGPTGRFIFELEPSTNGASVLETRHLLPLLRIVRIYYCSSLEDVTFRNNSADFLWMIIVSCLMLLVCAFVNTPHWNEVASRDANHYKSSHVVSYVFGGIYFYSSCIINVITYVWSKNNSSTRLTIFFFTIKASYLPWVLTLLSLIVDYNSNDNFLGILVGHIYFFFTNVFPLMPIAKNTQIFKTPSILLEVATKTGVVHSTGECTNRKGHKFRHIASTV